MADEPTLKTITLREAYKQGHTVDISAFQNARQWDRVDLFFDTYVPGKEDEPPGSHECYVAQDIQLRGGLKLFSVIPESEPCSIPISRKQAKFLYKDLQRIFEK